jgi:hypothetical protein
MTSLLWLGDGTGEVSISIFAIVKITPSLSLSLLTVAQAMHGEIYSIQGISGNGKTNARSI